MHTTLEMHSFQGIGDGQIGTSERVSHTRLETHLDNLSNPKSFRVILIRSKSLNVIDGHQKSSKVIQSHF